MSQRKSHKSLSGNSDGTRHRRRRAPPDASAPLPATKELPQAGDGRRQDGGKQDAEERPVPDAEVEHVEDYSVTGTLDQRFWLCPGSGGFKVRGATYLRVRAGPLLAVLAREGLPSRSCNVHHTKRLRACQNGNIVRMPATPPCPGWWRLSSPASIHDLLNNR